MGTESNFTQEQLDTYKKRLHSNIHWLLVYKEADDCSYFEFYFNSLLIKIESLSQLIGKQDKILDLYVTLTSAKTIALKDDCDFKLFRKLILDSHSILDSIDFKLSGVDR